MPGSDGAGLRLTHLIERLCEAGVELIVVGGVAAVSQGAPLTTFDLDIVHRVTDENVDRLLAVLATLHARHRGPGERVIEPTRADLSGGGHTLLTTDLGPLDVLGRIEHGLGYDELLGRSVELQVRGHSVRVLELEALLELKRGSTHPKDLRTVAILEEVLASRER